jgi:hypothetical protein
MPQADSLKLGKLHDRLHILKERVAASASTIVLPSAGNENNSMEFTAPAGLSSTEMGSCFSAFR